jgi:hypothetical protein
MIKINDIRTSRLRNDIHFQYSTDFRSLVLKYNPMLLKIESQFKPFQMWYEQEGECLKLILRSHISEQLNNVDQSRDAVFLGLISSIDVALEHFNPKVVETAGKLKEQVTQCTRLSGNSFEEETTAISELIRKLRDKYPTEVGIVGLQAWVNELEAHNRSFIQLMEKQEGPAHGLRIKNVRRETDRLYRGMVECINALMIVDGNAFYEQFIHELNSHIDRYNNVFTQKVS